MAKGKNLNPADAFRKSLRKKELKKNKADRSKARDFALVKKDTQDIEEEIQKLESASEPPAADRVRLQDLKAELEKINKKKEEYVQEHPEQRRLIYRGRKQESDGTPREEIILQKRNLFKKNGLPRHPERSIYYDPIMNPFGVAPPGMPYMERPLQPGEVDSEVEDDDDDDIAMPEGPPPGAQDGEEDDSDDEIPMPDGPPPGADFSQAMPPPPPMISPFPNPASPLPPLPPGPPVPSTSALSPPPPPPGGPQLYFPFPTGLPPPPPPPPPPGFPSGSSAPHPFPFPGSPLPPPPGFSNFPPLPPHPSGAPPAQIPLHGQYMPPFPTQFPPFPPPPPGFHSQAPPQGFFPRRNQSASAMQDPLSSLPHHTYQAHRAEKAAGHPSLPPNPTTSATAPPNLANSSAVEAATVSAAPQLRDFKREATSFVPSSLKRKKPGTGAGAASRVNAAPTLEASGSNDAEPEMSTARPDLLSALNAQFGPPPTAVKATAEKSNKQPKNDDYQKFVEEMGDVLGPAR